ncbi:MAG: hypothetical protein ACI8WB_006030 [Phenylobacterium sp.]|jgi:hypothetical protein
MSWSILILFIIAILLIILAKRKPLRGQDELQVGFTYRQQKALFTPAERSFLGVLHQAVGEQAQIFGKVRVADILTPEKNLSKSHWQTAFNKISAKHFDFVLCDKTDLSVLCVIELDDKSHNSKHRQARDQFLQNACLSANMPLIQIPAQASYNIHTLRQSLANYLPNESPNKTSNEQPDDNQWRAPQSDSIETPATVAKTCPKCSSEMVKRTASKGKNVGDHFWGCSGFPKCRYKEMIEG